MLGAGTLVASSRPLRSRMRPRLAGSSSVRAKRTSPCCWKNSLPNTCTQAARPASPTKPSAMAGHDELAAPDRRLARQQRAGGVGTLRAHEPSRCSCALRCARCGRAPARDRRRHAAVERTYCVMAGEAVRICSCSLASFSTRSGVACARFSTCSRSCSISQLARLARGLSSSVNSRRDSYCVRTRYSALDQHGQQQDEVEARHAHASGPLGHAHDRAARARIGRDLRGRRLDAVQRLAASSACGAANGARRSNTSRECLRDELLDDAVFQRMEADHHQPSLRVAGCRKLASSACCSSSSSALMKIRRA